MSYLALSDAALEVDVKATLHLHPTPVAQLAPWKIRKTRVFVSEGHAESAVAA